MRYLVFLRGIPGSGKSTFVKENGLEPYTISSDAVRILLKPPVLSLTGKLIISQKISRRVWGLIYSLIKSRMEEGEFTILDATNAGNADIAKYRKLVRNYRYKAFCVDFSDVPVELAKERNLKRPAYEIVPASVIEEIYSIIHKQTVPAFVTVIKPSEFYEKLQYQVVDLSSYRKIHHIGNINGNYTALMRYFACGLNDSDFYIFTGDYTGEGKENLEIIKFLISIMCKNNVLLLEGDREKCLCYLATGEEQTQISDFTETLYSLPAMEKSDTAKNNVLTKNCIFRLYQKMEPCIYYKFKDMRVLVTHGGLSNLPENLIYLGDEQMINGTGELEDVSLVAANFSKNTNENTYQIHGHRNPENLPIRNGRTFNLCTESGKIQGLRILTFDKEGFSGQEINKLEEKTNLGKIKPEYLIHTDFKL